MQPNDKQPFILMLCAVGEMFRYSVSEVAGNLWFEKLKPYTLEQVKQAFLDYLEEGQFFPTVAQIITVIDERQPRITKGLPDPDEIDMELSEKQIEMNKREVQKLIEGITGPKRFKLIKGKKGVNEKA